MGQEKKSLRLLKIEREEIWHNEVGIVEVIERMFDGYWKFSGPRGVKRVMFDPHPRDYNSLKELLKDYEFIFLKEYGELAKTLYM